MSLLSTGFIHPAIVKCMSCLLISCISYVFSYFSSSLSRFYFSFIVSLSSIGFSLSSNVSLFPLFSSISLNLFIPSFSCFLQSSFFSHSFIFCFLPSLCCFLHPSFVSSLLSVLFILFSSAASALLLSYPFVPSFAVSP